MSDNDSNSFDFEDDDGIQDKVAPGLSQTYKPGLHNNKSTAEGQDLWDIPGNEFTKTGNIDFDIYFWEIFIKVSNIVLGTSLKNRNGPIGLNKTLTLNKNQSGSKAGLKTGGNIKIGESQGLMDGYGGTISTNSKPQLIFKKKPTLSENKVNITFWQKRLKMMAMIRQIRANKIIISHKIPYKRSNRLKKKL